MADEENRCVVTLNKGVDAEQFVNEMLDNGYVLHDAKPHSRSNFDFIMTKAQAETLKSDERVRDVRYGSKVDNGIILQGFAERTDWNPSRSGLGLFGSRSATSSDINANWGLIAHAYQDSGNPNLGIANLGLEFDAWLNEAETASHIVPMTLTGKHVDLVIHDSGIDPDHPEFWGLTGNTSRYQTVDWPTISGTTGTFTQNVNYHRDLDGHGTHVAGIAGGNRNGWAPEANIYSLKILDDATAAFGVSASLTMLRAWHNSKGNNASTGVPNPTVVNMSWGYLGVYADVAGGQYRGANWTGTSADQTKGMRTATFSAESGGFLYPTRVTSVDSDIEDCIADGIIMVGAAGNFAHKCDIPGGDDYDNYWFNTSNILDYYHRGSTPGSTTGVISVGNIDSTYFEPAPSNPGKNQIATSSERGPRVDIFAAGTNIHSSIAGSRATSGTSTTRWVDDRDNTKFTKKLSGTSMASPQVAGVLATLAQNRTDLNQTDALNWLNQKASGEDYIHDTTTGTASTDYTETRALQGAKNKFLWTPYRNNTPFSAS